MKLKNRFFSKSIGCIVAVIAVVLGISSCDDDFTTDNSGFALYYTSMTDIAPSMNCVIASPTYKGAEPYDFKITEINFSYKDSEGKEVSEAYTGECFTINTENGAISINSTKDMKVGKYSISVSCYAAGNMYSYKNIVEVNFLKAVPEGIVVNPNFLEVKWADVLNGNSEAKFPTASVETENSAEHISVKGYKIANVVRLESDGSEAIINNNKIELFAVSDNGVISINKSNEYDKEEVKAGLYRIDLKITTAASSNLGEEEGLFVDALRVNFSGAPTAISYEVGAIETGVAGEEESKPRGSFTSSRPLVEGSTVNAVYEITVVKKSTNGSEPFGDASESEKSFFSIDSATGVVSVPDNHTFTADEVFKVSVKVTNPDGTYTGDDVLTLNVVEWVDPLVDFTYASGNMKQGMSFESAAADYGAGEYVKYSFKSLPEGYEDFFSINEKTGVVKIEKYNTLPRTEDGKPFVVEVKAKNFKDEVTGKLEINVVENPNYFTYISYGNNLVDDQTPGSIYDNQFRFTSLEDLNNIKLIPTSDIKEGAIIKWDFAGKHHNGGVSMSDKSLGVVTAKVSDSNWNKYILAVMFVTATVGEGEDAFSRTVPLFFHYSKTFNDLIINYTPFVLRVNPKEGGVSNVPTIINDKNVNISNLVINYRNTFSWFNLNGCRNGDSNDAHEDGRVDNNPGSQFLKNLWDGYGDNLYGSNYPLSFVDGTKPRINLADNLAYFDNNTGDNKYVLRVNPRKWYDEGWADGVFVGKVRYTTKGFSDLGSSEGVFPIAIWFDKNYVSK